MRLLPAALAALCFSFFCLSAVQAEDTFMAPRPDMRVHEHESVTTPFRTLGTAYYRFATHPWWRTGLPGQGPLPPEDNLRAAILETQFGCRDISPGAMVYLCPQTIRGIRTYIPVESTLRIRPFSGLLTPQLLRNAAVGRITCSPAQKLMAVPPLLSLHRSCTIGGQSVWVRFTMRPLNDVET